MLSVWWNRIPALKLGHSFSCHAWALGGWESTWGLNFFQAIKIVLQCWQESKLSPSVKWKGFKTQRLEWEVGAGSSHNTWSLVTVCHYTLSHKLVYSVQLVKHKHEMAEDLTYNINLLAGSHEGFCNLWWWSYPQKPFHCGGCCSTGSQQN